MNIHEYQAKSILRSHGMMVPPGEVAETPDEAVQIARNLKQFPVVIKAQIHAGGRGKGGGILLAQDLDQVRSAADRILGMQLITHQTGPEGKLVRKVLVEAAFEIEREFYLGVALDRASSRIVVMASAEGGVEIEEVAAQTPEKILRETVDPAIGLQAFQARKLAYGLGIPNELIRDAVRMILTLYETFVTCDCSLAEINPLVLTKNNQLLALDAKLNFDDNALSRQKQIAGMRDVAEEDPRELEASENGLSYVSLDGNIGCMVNGAGLAMATMDLIKLHGGEPANFLDVGGGASAEQVTKAFHIILADPKIQAILVNIFGGIMKCDVIAAGILEAAGQTRIPVPLVVRLEGTNVELGRKLLAESDLDIIAVEGLAEAAQKAVDAARGGPV